MNQAPRDDEKIRVLPLVLLSYFYIVGILEILGTVFVILPVKAVLYHKGLAGIVRILLVLGVLIGIFQRALWVKLEAPQGVLLMASQRVALLDLIEDIRLEIGGSFMHEVLVTDAFDVGVQQLPLWGFFGPNRNYLTIWLTLLASIPVTASPMS